MRKHAIVTICVMLSFCLRANFLPEISGNNNLVQLFENRDYIYSLKLFPVVCCLRNEPALLSRIDAGSSREGPRERPKWSRQDDAPILFDACPASHELYL